MTRLYAAGTLLDWWGIKGNSQMVMWLRHVISICMSNCQRNFKNNCLLLLGVTASPGQLVYRIIVGPHRQYTQSTQPATQSLCYLCEDHDSSQWSFGASLSKGVTPWRKIPAITCRIQIPMGLQLIFVFIMVLPMVSHTFNVLYKSTPGQEC